MKIKLLKLVVQKNKKRGGAALVSLVCLMLFALTPGAAQLKKQKLITALQLGDTAEGARVTIVSDSALNDYEAFRRGDRFYVKIPLADFTSPLPHFRADGFEDVQVQKVGDSVIISFKLQPGAAAHVDQRSNRLDVIFSAPNRRLRNNSASAGVNRDVAGPLPPGSTPYYRESETNDSRALRDSFGQVNPRVNSSKRGDTPSAGSNPAVNATAPVSSPSSVLTPSTSSSYPALTTATPVSSNSSAGTSGSAAPSGFLNWKTRGKNALQWVPKNRLASLLGALILLSLIVYLVMILRRRRENVVKAKRVRAPKVQPKVQSSDTSGAELFEVPEASPIGPNGPPAANNHSREFVSERPIAAAAASSPSHDWVLTKPSISSPKAGSEAGSEEQEREVFEL